MHSEEDWLGLKDAWPTYLASMLKDFLHRNESDERMKTGKRLGRDGRKRGRFLTR